MSHVDGLNIKRVRNWTDHSRLLFIRTRNAGFIAFADLVFKCEHVVIRLLSKFTQVQCCVFYVCCQLHQKNVSNRSQIAPT